MNKLQGFYALKKSNLNIEKVRGWYNLGERNDPDYIDFYL